MGKKSKSPELKKLKGVIIPLVLILLSAAFFAGALGAVAREGSWLAPWLTGQSTGGGTGTTGTEATETVIPTGKVSFKMQLIAFFADGSTQTLYEKSNLPALYFSVLSGGKAVSSVDAQAAAAVATSSPLPDTAKAVFQLNFSALVTRPSYGCLVREMKVICIEPPLGSADFNPKLIWFHRQVETPLIADGTVAMAVPRSISVLGSDIFPASQGAAQGEQRRVVWTLHATVRFTGLPAGYQLSLLEGYSDAIADFNFDGSIIDGCTNCGDGGTTIGGATFTPSPGGSSIGEFGKDVEVTVPPTPGSTILSSSVSSDGTIHEIVKSGSPDKTGTQRISQETTSPDWSPADVIKGTKQYHGAQLALAPYWRLEMLGTPVLVSLNIIFLAVSIAVLSFALGLATSRLFQKLFRKKR